MSAERGTYVDSSALVKLAVHEPESTALRNYLKRRSPLVCSALARTEVMRAVSSFGVAAEHRAREVLRRVDLVRIGDHILIDAGTLPPAELRFLDAFHLATANLLRNDLATIVTYDERMAQAARDSGWKVAAPS